MPYIQTKTAQKPCPLARYIPIQLIQLRKKKKTLSCIDSYLILFFLQKDGDVKEKPFYDSSEESEAEWEEDWDEQIQSLAWCFQANSPYSACPNMAKGLLVDSKEVWTFLAQ